jgi:hypothetical protein
LNHEFWTGVAQEILEMVIKGEVGCFTLSQGRRPLFGVYYSWETELMVPGNYGNFCGAWLFLYQPICI